MRFQSALQAGDHLGMPDDVFERRIGIADDLPAGMQIGPCQQSDKFTVLARNQRVVHDRRGGGNRIRAQRADMDEGAGRELEILDHAAGEDDALQRIVLIDEHAGIADAVKTFLVEHLLRQIRLAEIARA